MATTSSNIRVAVRCRPISKSEQSRGSSSCVEINQAENSVKIKNVEKADEPPKLFTFDYSYGDESLQSQVYTDLGDPLISKAIDGYNGTIFAYGQTGSGKWL